MTTASQGLAKALGRSASGETVAIAEMSAADLLASLSDEQKAELQAGLVPPAAAASEEPGEPDGAAPDGEQAPEADDADQGASASARVKAVAAAVATNDACKGKAGVALALLADDDFAGLSASALVKMVAQSGAAAPAADTEAAARAEMQAALAAQGNSQIDAGGALQPDAQAQAAAIWDKARSNIFPNQAK